MRCLKKIFAENRYSQQHISMALKRTLRLKKFLPREDADPVAKTILLYVSLVLRKISGILRR
jgi:hypothetical protein